MNFEKMSLFTYQQSYLDQKRAQYCLLQLIEETPWHQEELKIYGKDIPVPRLVAWYGNPEAVYTYSKVVHYPLPWTQELLEIKREIETFTRNTFNSVLLNYYRDGKDYMGWHSDSEKELGENPVIASLSLGATRTFHLRDKKTKKLAETIELENGSLLIMQGDCQLRFQHRISPTKKDVGPRINLTFRNIIKPN